MKTVLRTIVVLAVLGTLAGAVIVYFGVYNVAATNQDNPALFHFLHYAMRRSVARRAESIKVPPDLMEPRHVHDGFQLFRQHCAQCHGAPGVAPDPFAFGLRPAPPNLVDPAREWRTADIHWAIKHGLTKTAMPAWDYRLSEQQLWDVTAFVKQLPALSPTQYREWSKANPHDNEQTPTPQQPMRPSDAKIGRHVIQQYLCITCHVIPGVTGAQSTVGPPLTGIATRQYIAGVLPNNQDNMMRWLRNPQAVVPLAGMPNLHIREQDLRDITAYLYTLNGAQ